MSQRVFVRNLGGTPIVTELINVDDAGNVNVATGNVLIGDGDSVPTFQQDGGPIEPTLQVFGENSFSSSIGAFRFADNAGGAYLILGHSRGVDGDLGASSQLDSGDAIGSINFVGSDGAGELRVGAGISAFAAANWADNDVPGALIFFTTADGGTTSIISLRLDEKGNVLTGAGAIATNATDGFLYVPTCAGTPTGTPTTIAGLAPIVVNTTNNKLYFYSGGAWRDAGP